MPLPKSVLSHIMLPVHSLYHNPATRTFCSPMAFGKPPIVRPRHIPDTSIRSFRPEPTSTNSVGKFIQKRICARISATAIAFLPC